MKKKTELRETSGKSLVIITGMSGSGKHTAFKALEDLGFFCVDNLPTRLIPRLIQMTMASGGGIDKLAVVVDVRLGESDSEFKRLLQELEKLPFDSTVIFFDASDQELARRYSETRRTHPLARNTSLLEGVQEERKKLSVIRSLADRVIDTSEFSVHDLRKLIYKHFRERSSIEDALYITLVSFGFKHGIPFNSDMLFDVRFLPNPNFEPFLKEKTGSDPEVVDFLRKHPETEEIIGKISDMLEYLLPKYIQEGKSYFTVSIGCTGGRHRSVMIAEALEARLQGRGHRVNLIHRDEHLQ